MSLKSMVTVPIGSPIRALCRPLAAAASLPRQLAIENGLRRLLVRRPGFRRGDLVVAPLVWSDGTCDFCCEGLQTSCRHGGQWAANGVDGGQGEAVRVLTGMIAAMRPFSPVELDIIERFLHGVAAVTRWQDDRAARASSPEQPSTSPHRSAMR